MLSILLWIVGSLIGALLLMIVVKDLWSLYHLQFYRKQGMKVVYFPFLGWNSLLVPKAGTDQLEKMRQLFIKSDQANTKIIASNTNKNVKNLLLLVDKDILKEFFRKETQYTAKVPMIKNMNLGFFWANGKKALRNRSVFGKFFKISNLNKLTPRILEIVENHFAGLKKTTWANKSHEEYCKIEWKDELNKLFTDIVSCILFDEKKSPLVDGQELPLAITTWLNQSMRQLSDPVNLLTFDFFHNNKLLSTTRRDLKKYKKIEEVCYDFYKKRVQEGPKGGINMMDLMIDEQENNGFDLTKEDLAGNIILLQFAGADTSKETSSTFLNYLASQPKFQNEINDAIKDEVFTDFESFDKNQALNLAVLEALRLFSPFPISSPRLALRNFKLGKFKIMKGTRICFPIGFLQTFEKYHESPKEYKPERYTPENRKKMENISHIPFGSGKRICIGQYMGEMMVKVVISTIIKTFELKKVENYNPPRTMQLTYGVPHCWTYFRPRSI